MQLTREQPLCAATCTIDISMSCPIASVQQCSSHYMHLHSMIAIASHTQHTHNTRYVSTFEPSGIRLRLTAICTDTCISQRSFQQAFGPDCGKDEAPKFELVPLEAVRLALTPSLHLLQQSPICAAYIGFEMTSIARHGLIRDRKKSGSEGSGLSGCVRFAVLACQRK